MKTVLITNIIGLSLSLIAITYLFISMVKIEKRKINEGKNSFFFSKNNRNR